MPHLYFAPWEWVLDPDESQGGYWAAPIQSEVTAVQDWRPVPAQGTPAVAAGFGLFAYPTPVAIPGSLSLGDDPLALVRPTDRAALAAYLGVVPSLPSGNLMELLHFLNTERNDPAGLVRWSGRRMTRDGIGVSVPGFGEMQRFAYDEAHPSWTTSVLKFQDAYRRRKARGEDLAVLQRYTGATILNLKGEFSLALAERVLPPEYQSDGARRPTSTYADDFTDTNGTALTSHTPTGTNAGTGWTVLESDGCEVVTGDIARNITNEQTSHMMMDDALSADAMDSQINLVTITEPDSGQNTAGVCVRMVGSANTNYYVRIEHIQGSGSGTWNAELGQRVTGTKTLLDENANRGDPSLPAVLKISVNGDASALESFIDAVSENTADDSASEIGVGNVNGGFTLFTRAGGAGAAQCEIDDFSTTDNVAGGSSIPVFMYHYQQMQRG